MITTETDAPVAGVEHGMKPLVLDDVHFDLVVV